MHETNNVKELINLIRNKNKIRIGIDGTNGSGKTTLAVDLSKLLGFTHINLDDFLVKYQGAFLTQLKYDQLKEKISTLNNYIIDGVCLLEVLEEIDNQLDFLIYVKRMQHDIWADEEGCNIEGDVEEFIQKEKEIIAMIDRTNVLPDSLGLAEEIIRYHDKYKPHNNADILFKRNDC